MEAGYKTYTVQANEHLLDVARKNHVSVKKLISLNHINFFKVPVKYHQVLKVKKINYNSQKRQKVIKTAKSFLGTRYKWGGEGYRGIDCSGLTLRSYKSINIEIERVSSDQFSQNLGRRFKNFKSAKPGDLIFFSTKRRRIGHVGIVINPKKHTFIQASSGKHRVVISRYDIGQYKRRFRGFKRIIK